MHQVEVENNDETQEPEPAPKLVIILCDDVFLYIIRGFWDWMYPEMAGNENVEMAALGVLILWFSW